MYKHLLVALVCLFVTTVTLQAQDPLRLVVTDVNDDSNSRDASTGDGVCADNAGRCTLRAAIDEANAQSGEVVIVIPGTLPGGVVGTYSLSRVAPNTSMNTYEDNNEYGDLDLTGSFSKITLQGTGIPGPTLTISPNDRILDIASGKSVDLERIHFTGGTARAGNSGNPDGSGSTGVNGEDGEDGGALYIGMNATVNIDQCTFSGNTTQSGGNGATPGSSSVGTTGGDAGSGGNGGAIFIASGATVTMNRTTVTGNGTGDAGSAADALGVNSDSAAGGRGGDGGNGGGIYNAGTLTVKNSTIGNNTNGDPGTGGGGVNGGATGETGAGGSGGGIANARLVDGTLTVEGSATLTNSIVAKNTAGDDQSNGKQPGANLFDGDDNGGSFTSGNYLILGINDAVESLTAQANDLIGTASSEIDPLFQGLNGNSDEAVPTLMLGMSSPAINAGTNTDGMFNFDARGFERPADGQADIGAYEANSQRIPASLQLTEIDVQATAEDEEFVEIMNNGDYPVQLDAYVVVGFDGANGTACYVGNLYGELQPGEMFVLGDAEMNTTDQSFTLDATSDNCGSSSSNQIKDDNGALGLYRGDGTNFNGISAGSQSSSREDIIVYDNSASLTGGGSANRNMMDLCSAFGLSAGCAASDDGDNSSIQRDASGGLTTGTPSPGATNSGAALPVALLHFTATTTARQTALLRWTTATERNNAGFAVEQFELASQTWREIAWVRGATDSERPTDYAHETTPLDAGQHLFRLRQVDLDGGETVLPTVSVKLQPTATRFELFPNPTVNDLTLRFDGAADERIRIEVLDAYGRIVLVAFDGVVGGASDLPLNTNHLPAGNYRLRVLSRQDTVFLPFTKG